MTTHAPTTPVSDTPDPATPELYLPASLGWYREAANWLVGLATAAIVFSITNVETLQLQSITAWLYALMLLAFLVSTLSGIVFYFFITEYAHNFLKREQCAALYALAGSTPEQKARYATNCVTSQTDANKSADSYNLYFMIMLPSFAVGVLLAFSLAVGMVLIKKPDKTARSYKLQPVPTTLLTPHGVMMIDEATGTSWLLESDTAKRFQWHIIKPPIDDTKP